MTAALRIDAAAGATVTAETEAAAARWEAEPPQHAVGELYIRRCGSRF